MVRMTVRTAFALAIALGLGGCKPSAGSSCERGEARCLNAERVLVCQQGKFIETPCRGKLGCRLEAAGTACDVSGNRTGDACSTDEEGTAGCADEKTLVACRRGAYVRAACRGPGGCSEEAGRARCDATVAEAGESCADEGKKACAFDAKRVLACRGGKLSPAYECRGPNGCRVAEGKLDCDLSLARAGDACDRLVEGHFACSEDARSLLRCASGRFVADDSCKPGERCLSEPGSTRCAKPER